MPPRTEVYPQPLSAVCHFVGVSAVPVPHAALHLHPFECILARKAELGYDWVDSESGAIALRTGKPDNGPPITGFGATSQTQDHYRKLHLRVTCDYPVVSGGNVVTPGFLVITTSTSRFV